MNTLIKFNEFVKEINSNNGRNYKLSVLEKYKNDEVIKRYLHFIYNPYITTGISDKKLNRIVHMDPIMNLNTMFEVMDFVQEYNTGTDSTIAEIQDFRWINILTCDSDDKQSLLDLFNEVITKNLILGVSVLSINKIIPNLIPTFDVMLANKYFDNPEYVEGKEFALTTKIDGGRIIAIKENGITKFFTRQGQLYEGLVDLENELNALPIDNICFDGEITLLNGEGMSSKDQYKQTMKITRKDGEKHGVKMLVFDFMLSNEFKEQCCKEPYKYRREALDIIFNKYNLTYFTKLPLLYSGSDVDQITKYLNQAIASNEEGIMINILDAPYSFKRTSDLLKVKKMNDIDLPIIGYEEGNNTNKGKLGAFIVDYKGNSVKVGSGFSKELREEVWQHPEDYIGQVISVQYFEETTNQNGGISLRFPVFLDFRPDLT